MQDPVQPTTDDETPATVVPRLSDTGADHVIVTDEQDLVDTAMAVSDGHGIDVVFDPIGGSMLPQLA